MVRKFVKEKGEQRMKGKDETFAEDCWGKFAPVYAMSMNLANGRAYRFLYYRIRKVVQGKKVLEIATGPGLIAKRVADVTESMLATDFSVEMLIQARKGRNPKNLRYEWANASRLPYPDGSFDVVIISNALHVIPEPENVLAQIRRVLKPKGILIAPNFIHDNDDKKSNFFSGALTKMGVDFEAQWNEESYQAFLEKNGFRMVNHRVLDAFIPLMYTELVKRNQ